MSTYVIEGTWEEIEHHKSELIGRHLSVTVAPDPPTGHKASSPRTNNSQERVLRARGAYKGMFGGTEAIIAEKKAQIELEEQNL